MRLVWMMILACQSGKGVGELEPRELEIEGDEEGECSDGADNDEDGLADCEDEGCVDSPDCDLGIDQCWSLQFDGVDDFADTPMDPFTNAQLVSGTAEAWVRINPDSRGVIFSVEGCLNMGVNPEGYFSGCSDGVCNGAASTTVADDQWHQLVMTWGETSTILYVDGVLQNTVTVSNTPLVDSYDRTLRLGHHPRSEPQDLYLEYEISSLKLYSTRLTDSEVMGLYTGDERFDADILQYAFNHQELNDTVDELPLTVNGTAWSEACPD